MLTHDIFVIIIMLLGAAAFGLLIGWFSKNYRLERLEGYIKALEDKLNRTQDKLQLTEKELIDCQTNRKKTEAEMDKLGQKAIDNTEDIVKEEKKIEKEKKKGKEDNKITTQKKKKEKTDDLKKIEGIGPKIAGILKDAGIDTFETLSNQSSARITEILTAAGGNSYNRFNPETWPDQAKMASEGKWDELAKWQDELKGGKKTRKN